MFVLRFCCGGAGVCARGVFVVFFLGILVLWVVALALVVLLFGWLGVLRWPVFMLRFLGFF
ncbi:hypothetical protein AAGG41_21045, partial [Stenotrophomonas maltophilia]